MLHPSRLDCRVDHTPPAAAPAPLAEPGPAELPRRVTAALAHNVNNALTGVIGHLELALREAEPGSPLHARLGLALGGAFRAAERVRRTVAFARRPQAREATEVCLGAAAGEATRAAAVEAPALRVVVQAPQAPCPVVINEPLLRLVLEQLVSNAVEAMPGGGTLTLRAWDEGPRRCLSVGDSGPGLSAEVRRRLFEPFFTTKSFGHLGLGLALCRDVIEAQGGALHLTSGEGHGTTVTLSFPPPPPADTFAI
ncbi:MAG TPA: HAMP domain-containing sensor histidine kinase [Gemmataceae bacterium]|nr:HAMP domain-containing sensor histidine kinase [Gemmataceae bacterium]